MTFNSMTKKQLLSYINENLLSITPKEKITTSEEAHAAAIPLVTEWRQEHLIGLYLDTGGNILKKDMVFKGTLDFATIHPREIFAPAVSLRASAVIILHNHPCGDLNPSSGDVKATLRLIAAGRLIGIEMTDHIIFSAKTHFSMKSFGFFETVSDEVH